MAYGVYQLRSFQDIDDQHKTMKDFVGMIIGLPRLSGELPVEEKLKACVSDFTNTKVVGVSVAWDYQEQNDAVATALAADLQEQEFKHVGAPRTPPVLPEMNFVREAFYNFEQTVFGLGAEEKEEPAKTEKPIKQLLKELYTSPRAFVVFETEEDRNEAIDKIAKRG